MYINPDKNGSIWYASDRKSSYLNFFLLKKASSCMFLFRPYNSKKEKKKSTKLYKLKQIYRWYQLIKSQFSSSLSAQTS
jgi:hypothetical protein